MDDNLKKMNQWLDSAIYLFGMGAITFFVGYPIAGVKRIIETSSLELNWFYFSCFAPITCLLLAYLNF